MRRVADVAGQLGTSLVRVFSFFIPAGQPPEQYRAEVIDRMGALAAIARERGLSRSVCLPGTLLTGPVFLLCPRNIVGRRQRRRDRAPSAQA